MKGASTPSLSAHVARMISLLPGRSLMVCRLSQHTNVYLPTNETEFVLHCRVASHDTAACVDIQFFFLLLITCDTTSLFASSGFRAREIGVMMVTMRSVPARHRAIDRERGERGVP